MRSTPTRAVLAVATIALVAAACTSSTSEPGPGADQTRNTDPDTTDVEPSISDNPENVRSPGNGENDEQAEAISQAEAEAIAFSSGYFYFSDDAWSDYLAALRIVAADREEFILTCMRSEGFQYFPDDLDVLAWKPSYSVEATSKEWADLYGMGETTTLFHQNVLGEIAVGYLGPIRPQPNITESSPEAIYLNGLSKEEYRAYSVALSGFDIEEPWPSSALLGYGAPDSEGVGPIDGSTRFEPTVVNESACQRQAFERFPDPMAVSDDTEELGDRVLASREWTDFLADGWRCVAEQGIDTEFGVANLVIAYQEELGMFAEEFGDISNDPEELPVDFVDLLAEAQEFERQLARILWGCGVHPIQERDRFVEIVDTIVLE